MYLGRYAQNYKKINFENYKNFSALPCRGGVGGGVSDFICSRLTARNLSNLFKSFKSLLYYLFDLFRFVGFLPRKGHSFYNFLIQFFYNFEAVGRPSLYNSLRFCLPKFYWRLFSVSGTFQNFFGGCPRLRTRSDFSSRDIFH